MTLALTLFLISGINRKSVAAILGTTGGVLTAGIIIGALGAIMDIGMSIS